jgi:hypothetical protein
LVMEGIKNQGERLGTENQEVEFLKEGIKLV